MADIDPPYRFDPLQNPVNIKWTSETTPLQIGWYQPFFGGALDGPWIQAFLSNPNGDVTHEFVGIYHFTSNDDLTTRLLTQPVDAQFKTIKETWIDAYFVYITTGTGVYPKQPYIKAEVP